MCTVAIIQARMSSTRLPGKVLLPIGPAPMLTHVVERSRRATLLDDVVVATTTDPQDDAIVAHCQTLGVCCMRGSRLDVLDRYYRAALGTEAKWVVRITSDCPLIDPDIIDRVVRQFGERGADYASSSLTKKYPRGLDTEIMTFASLERAWHEAHHAYERVHVTPYLYRHPELFNIFAVEGDGDFGHHRWTVDTPEDLELVRAIYTRLGNRNDFDWRDALRVVETDPTLANINRFIRQKTLEEG